MVTYLAPSRRKAVTGNWRLRVDSGRYPQGDSSLAPAHYTEADIRVARASLSARARGQFLLEAVEEDLGASLERPANQRGEFRIDVDALDLFIELRRIRIPMGAQNS